MNNYLGVHVSRRRDRYWFCILGDDLSVRVLERGSLTEVLGYAAGEDTRAAGIDAPVVVNSGLMARDEVRQRFSPPPAENRFTNLRLGEYELVRKKMKIYRTADSKGACPKWMRNGFRLYARLAGLGYQAYLGEESGLGWLEVPSEAAFHAVIGQSLLPVEGLEGRIQRQLLLWKLGVQVPDPMEAFEEITRYRMERGKFPFQRIHTSAEQLAIMCAFMAWTVEKNPAHLVQVGAEEEGKLTLPVKLISD